MKLTTAFLALLAAALSTSATSTQVHLTDDDLDVPGDNPMTYCEDPKDWILDIESVDLDPNPPQAGKDLTITAKGTLNQEVKDGTKAYLQVKWGLIKIFDQSISLCEHADEVDLSCPIDGEVEIKKVVTLPKEIPPGTYNVFANVTTEDDDQVTCLKASVPFKIGGLGSMFGSDDL